MDLDHSVDLVVRHLVGLVNHLVDLRDSRQVRKDYLVDIHCMLDDLLQDDTFDYTKKTSSRRNPLYFIRKLTGGY